MNSRTDSQKNLFKVNSINYSTMQTTPRALATGASPVSPGSDRVAVIPKTGLPTLVECDVVKYGPDEHGDAKVIEKDVVYAALPSDVFLTAGSAFDITTMCRRWINDNTNWQYFGARLSCSLRRGCVRFGPEPF